MTMMTMAMSAALAMAGTQDAVDQEPAPVQVMVIGSWHMAGSNANVIDIEGIDVLTPQRQAEFDAMIERLAAFEPTVVAIEREAEAPAFVYEAFADFEPSMLAENAGEEVQIAFRLARRVGLDTVYGIDEKTREGDPVYFPMGKMMEHVEAEGRMDEVQAMIAESAAEQEAQMARFAEMDVGDALAETNARAHDDHAVYYRFGEFDSGESQPGSELQAYWFMRNAKIFAKLMDVTKPGDRVVVVYGNGHKYWLDHFADKTPGYVSVDPVRYLKSE